MGMLAWLVIGISVGGLRESLRRATTPAQSAYRDWRAACSGPSSAGWSRG